MATVSAAVLVSLLSWLLLWAVLMAGYLAVVTAADYLRARWRQYQRVRQYRHAVAAELARIDRETSASVRRIGAVFTIAHELVRSEAADNRSHRS